MDLLLPRRCAGCGDPGEVLCGVCRERLRRPPTRVVTPVDTHAPVWSLGPYAATHRGVILAMKERRNLAVRRLLGPVLAAAVGHLQARGELPELLDAPAPLTLVPAPTRAGSARLRGGDHVTDLCRASGLPVIPALRHRPGVRDQVGLDAEARRRNLAGSVQLRTGATVFTGPVLLVDDVVTTGSTLAAAAEVLTAAGVTVSGAIVIAHA